MSTVVISGASKGIGKAAAAQFIGAGHLVFNLSRSPVDLTGIKNIQLGWVLRNVATFTTAG